ncbi:hypothetical protein GGD67_002302 [Bradyrhizobium sp. IAR9]|uniref:hypothetical protein n=1 Tax=Bradyrhizobium sp. IAR9 TaxID=2663841 RepID=UPI0015C74FAB|nr:hypothetical protein [Bradyrhizobium sp. IAR9]NYG44854.1 hypothetical protein [Bradyrhizobium sp. IAR9]
MTKPKGSSQSIGSNKAAAPRNGRFLAPSTSLMSWTFSPDIRLEMLPSAAVRLIERPPLRIVSRLQPHQLEPNAAGDP